MNFYSLYTEYVTPLRNSKILFKSLFGYIPPGAVWGQYWDWTTITLRGCLNQYLMPNMEFLDMGCGPYAVLSRYAQLKLKCQHVTAVDHCGELIIFAKDSDPDSKINYVCSNLFSNIVGQYSLIAFNAPYLDPDMGASKGLINSELAKKRFCGGKDGAQTIQHFLHDLPVHLQRGGKVLLGVNHYHIRQEVVRSAIYKEGLKTISLRFNPLTRACVYVLMEKNYA